MAVTALPRAAWGERLVDLWSLIKFKQTALLLVTGRDAVDRSQHSPADRGASTSSGSTRLSSAFPPGARNRGASSRCDSSAG